ncbi:hypothetical protein hamaS1_22410 [Moorella sp. Hama-1]|nr:hypothetical protein hamaS1_22410 [Moorella sp. Hama-1]
MRFVKGYNETRTDLWINQTDPIQNISNWTVPKIVWDILDYLGYPGTIIGAAANNVLVDGTYVYSESNDGNHDRTVSFRRDYGFDRTIKIKRGWH